MPSFNGYRSRIFYTGNGSAQNLSIFFPYLDPTHIHVYFNEVLQEDNSWSWLNDATLTITAAVGVTIEIRRSTPLDPLVTFTNASLLNEDDQNTAALQAIYLIEEGADGVIIIEQLVNNDFDASVVFVIDGGGYTLLTGNHGCLQVPFAGTITSATILADQTGDAVVDIWKDTYDNYPPTDADSITGSAPLTITDGVKATATLTTWNTTLAAGSVLSYNLDSVTAIQRLTVTLKIRKS